MGWGNTKSPLEAVALIHEEVAELGQELRQHVIDLEKTGDEMADIILRTVDLAQEMGINLDAAVDSKIDKNMSNIARHKAKGRRV